MTHIFISYAKKDTRELALSLAEALNQLEGITAWVDRSLRAGKSWELQIQSEIDRCDTMVVLYSPDINRHKNGQSESYVLTEIAYAKWTARKPIIPVMAQPTDPPISLTMEHYIDFTLDGLTLDDLVAALCDELGVEMKPSVVAPPPAVTPLSEVDLDKEVADRPDWLRGADADDLLSKLKLPSPIFKPTSLSLLPAPFAWVEIPGGRGTLKTDEDGVTLAVPTERYWIARYPVANAHFAKFIEAGGYRERRWWTDAGWEARAKGWAWKDGKYVETGQAWTEPRYWRDSKWNGPEQPVVGVSWYEALAFCLWLSDVTGEQIMLPTGEQWQYAAQGDDGWKYPWGDKWDCKRCNNSVKPCKSDRTTPVRQYEGIGDSPFGVVDMAGNVWEWCLTAYETRSQDINGTDARVLRGGSWANVLHIFFYCVARESDKHIWEDPRAWDIVIGFRIVRIP